MPVITGERYSDPSTISYPDAIFSARNRQHAEFYAFFSPFSTASAVIGMWRTRTPTAL